MHGKQLFLIVMASAFIGTTLGLNIDLTPRSSAKSKPKTQSNNRVTTANTTTNPYPNTTAIWQPTKGTSWQIVLSSPLSNEAAANPAVAVEDIDLFDNTAETITHLHSLGRKVICYFSAGTFEDWRSDHALFTKDDYGNALSDWPGEWWLNTNSDNVRSIMSKRLDMAKTKGCDGVDPDNVDGYDNDTGFDLTKDNAVNYLAFLASEGHKRNLAVGLKNAVDIVGRTVNFLEWAVVEQCLQFKECSEYRPFINQNKPIFHIEYPDGVWKGPNGIGVQVLKKNCKDSSEAGFSTLLKSMELNETVIIC